MTPGHHHAHAHGGSTGGDARRLTIALALILGLMAAEVAAGIAASSLALLSDAGHMVTDALAIALSLAAIELARRPARGAMTYGLKRLEILSAQFNGAALLVLATLIVYEAIRRLIAPPATDGLPMLVVALAGIAVNLLATFVLAGAQRHSLAIEGSFRHILTDLYAFVGTAVAAVVILTTGFVRADAIASLLVAGLMLHASYGLLRESGRIFLEAAPRGLDPQAIGGAMAATADVAEVHDLHVWEVTSGFPALSAHVLVKPGRDCNAARHALEALLRDRFQIEHTTLQVEHEGGDLLELEVRPLLPREP